MSSRDASLTTRIRNQRVLYADKVAQQTAFDKKVKSYIVFEGGNYGGAMGIATYNKYVDGTTETTVAEEASYIAAVPPANFGAPSTISAIAGNASASVSFNLVNGVTSYIVTSSPGGYTSSGTSSPLNVTGLTNGVSYTFTVQSVYLTSASQPSAPSNAVTPLGPPNPPQGVYAIETGLGTSMVYFNPPTSDGGSPVTSYTAISSPGNYSITGQSSPLTLTTLPSGNYTFRVYATNSVGNSALSAASSPAMRIEGLPGAPTGVSASLFENSATISFTAPADDGGEPILYYTVVSNPGGLTATSNGSPIVIDNLVSGVTYTFTVSATNKIGTGPQSSPSNQVVVPTSPTAPQNVSAVAGSSSATVSFNAPLSDGGSPITSYTVVSSPGGVTEVGSASPITIDGLTNGIAYTFTVFASNAYGNGPASSASNSVVPSGGATIVTFPTVGTTTWTAPAGVTSIEYLVVGGGGGSGGGYDTGGGGGGGGGMVLSGTYAVTGGTVYNIGVGDGGSAGISIRNPVSETNGGSGGNSYFDTITALGGGGGYASRLGGGTSAGGIAVSGGAASTGGIGGGNIRDGNGAGGGGGGNITNGSNGVSNTGGAGGAGISNSIRGTPATYGAGGRGANGNTTSGNAGVAGAANTGNGARGGGAASSASNSGAKGGSGIVIIKYTPVSTPTAPTNLVGTPASTSISVAFTAPSSDGGAAISNYKYSIDNGASYNAFSPADTTSPVVISGLSMGTLYNIKLRAVNAAGDGAESTAIAVTTLSITTPSAPTNLVGTAGITNVTVRFLTPASDGGATITNYEYSIDNGLSFTAFSPEDASSPVTINGLTANTSYNIQLRAVNSVGAGTASSTLAVTTSVALAPTAPTLTLALPDNLGAYIYFDAGSGGGAAENYEYTTDSGETYTPLNPASVSSPVRIPLSTNGITYTVELRAVNSIGSSAISNGLNVTPVNPSVASAWLYFDPSNTSSYSGTGNTVNNIGSYGALSGTKAAAVSYNSSIKGGVFDFNGGNGSVISFGSFNFGNAISATAWVYPRYKKDINGLLANATANVNPTGFKLQWNWWQTDSRVLSMQAGNGSSGRDNNTITDIVEYNKWQHFGYVFDQTKPSIIFFLNGLPAAMATTTSPVSGINMNAAFNIGGYIGGSYTMNAQLGYIKVFNSLLDATQIKDDYDTTKSRFL